MELENIIISQNRTHHLYNNVPIYPKRFIAVEKFHQPGLAPVLDDSGAYHIDIYGNNAYNDKFEQSFGFYCGYAAVVKNSNWFHILCNGTRIYSNSFDWVGNFQENLCVVKSNKYFFHITISGEPLYSQRYQYVGDFKDGHAVVYLNNKATHINNHGEYTHNQWFKRLYNFHKNYACAADENGWFHIDSNGKELYTERYKNVEQFYNKQALVESFDGQIKQINLENDLTNELVSATHQANIDELYGDLIGFWKIKIVATAVKLNLFELFPNKTSDISSIISIPIKNLVRLLKALWEINIVAYDLHKDVWILTDKGAIFNFKQYKFLSAAAIMWNKVSNLDWNKLATTLKQSEIPSFISFKDKEQNPETNSIYQSAVDGYLKLDLEKIIQQIIKVNNLQNMICIGRSAKLFTEALKKQNTVFEITSRTSLSALKEGVITSKHAILLKFIHYFDDNKADQIIKLLYQAGITNIIIVEMLISNDKPVGGMLDINMLIECGGKLRNKIDYSIMLNKHGYKINHIQEINPYLHMIYAQI